MKKASRSSKSVEGAKASAPTGSKQVAARKASAKVGHFDKLTYELLCEAHRDAHCELVHADAFQLLVATVLSAQSTDVAVNALTPELFARYATPAQLAAAPIDDVERLIARIGMFRQKARRIVELSKLLVERHGGAVPARLEDLVELPGVGRKTANVVLGVWFRTPVGIVVDTHVQRLVQRLGWSVQSEPEPIEQELMLQVPHAEWDRIAHVLIFHGRRICSARKPACDRCPIANRCPSAFEAEHVGRKGAR